MHYRLHYRVPGETAVMAVGFVAMIDAVASGVAFSRDPNLPEPAPVLIQAVRGLGVTLADGRSVPEVILVARETELAVATRRAPVQSSHIVCDPASGVREEMLDEAASARCLEDSEALALARWALELETHFGRPQDIEWAMDGQRRLVLLQARPLRVATHAVRAREPAPGFQVLVGEGEVACPGVGTGVAVRLDEDGDLDSFPEGGVLVARRSSPKFVRVMEKARAIVTDAGGATGHMASLAREFRVPTLLGTKTATRAIPPGTLVTVDASSGFVYAGEVPGLKVQEAPELPARSAGARAPATRALTLLEKAADLIVPLHLTDPGASDFAEARCRTLHDIARYVHEKSYEEMFHMGEKLGDFRAASYYLDVFLPIDLYLIDLGGGLRPPIRGRKVKVSHLTSVPFAALIRGMLHPKIPRFGPRPMDVRGLLSIMARHALTSPETDRTFRDPCYAMVSDRYLNYTARVGYHFGVVDSYCGKTENKNYISLLFRGGAADIVRRRRRAGAIAGIHRAQGFAVTLRNDVVNARFGKASREETAAQLEMVGRLLQFMRQMDVAMSSDAAARWVQEAFLAGNYGLEEGRADGPPSAGSIPSGGRPPS
jgi:pyruvate,water dikinase